MAFGSRVPGPSAEGGVLPAGWGGLGPQGQIRTGAWGGSPARGGAHGARSGPSYAAVGLDAQGSNTGLFGTTQFKWSLSELETHVELRKTSTARSDLSRMSKMLSSLCYNFVINVYALETPRDTVMLDSQHDLGGGRRGGRAGEMTGPRAALLLTVLAETPRSSQLPRAGLGVLPKEISGGYLFQGVYLCILCLLLCVASLGVEGVVAIKELSLSLRTSIALGDNEFWAEFRYLMQ